MNKHYIYFEPRTGVVKNEPIRSNYYVYRVPSSCLAHIELAAEHDAVLHSTGLVFPDEFMAWLNEQDTKWDQKTGLTP